MKEDKLEKILKSELEIPKQVEDKMQEAYRMIGAHEKEKRKVSGIHCRWSTVAAAAFAVVVLTTAVQAAGLYYSKTVIEEEEKVTYMFDMDYDLTPYDIAVSPEYIPDGYRIIDSDQYHNKMRNDETGRGITIIPYNGANIDEHGPLNFTNVKNVEKTEIQNLEAHIYTMEDRKLEVKDIVMFNEKEGYLIFIYSDGKELSIEELKKVAENLKITKLDTKSAYKSARERKMDEIAQELWIREWYDFIRGGISSKRVCEIGEEMKNPNLEKLFPDNVADIRYTVESVEVKDKLEKDEFPEENFKQYEEEVKPWLEDDGTLKPRMRYSNYGGVSKEDKKTGSKFVVVKMKAHNLKESEHGSETVSTFGAQMAPTLGYYKAGIDGNLTYYLKEPYLQERDYELQGSDHGGASFPIYFDKAYHLEGNERLKQFFWRPLLEGEILEYTLVYVVDDDLIEHAYLQSYHNGTVNGEKNCTYVKITK